MAIHKQSLHSKVATGECSTGIEQHLLGAAVLAITMAVVLASLAG
jgi:hypothetical protein